MNAQRHEIYGNVPVVPEDELVDWQYTAYPEAIAEDPPPSLIRASFSQRAGAFRADPLNNPKVSYVDASSTTMIIAHGGPANETYIVPVRSSWEKGELPEETNRHLPLHATLTMISQENLEIATEYEESQGAPHTHPTTPHAGLFSSEKTKLEYRRSQIGASPLEIRPRRRLTQAETVGEDGIAF